MRDVCRLQTSVAELATLLPYNASLEVSSSHDAVRVLHGWERFLPGAG